MCSSILTIVFNVMISFAIILTFGALITPQWRKVKVGNSEIQRGLLWQVCDLGNLNLGTNSVSSASGAQDTANGLKGIWNDCMKDYWSKQLEDWEKATAVMLAIVICLLIVCSIYSCVMCCCQACCKSCASVPLIILTFLSFLFEFIAIVVYGVKQKDEADAKNGASALAKSVLNMDDSIGYSMYLAIISMLVLLGATILCIIKWKCVKF